MAKSERATQEWTLASTLAVAIGTGAVLARLVGAA
jgi:hypothetical protein